jgi:hypothetical protein
MKLTETPQKNQKAASIPIEEMVDLKSKGLSLAQIGKMAGISKQAVSQALKRSGLDPEEIKTFKRDKSLIFHGKQKILLNHITPERVKAMSVRDATVSLGIIYDKTRLEDDKSTANVSFHSIPAGYLDTLRSRKCANCEAWQYGPWPDGGDFCPACREDIKRRESLPAKVEDDLTPINLKTRATEGGGNGA